MKRGLIRLLMVAGFGVTVCGELPARGDRGQLAARRQIDRDAGGGASQQRVDRDRNGGQLRRGLAVDLLPIAAGASSAMVTAVSEMAAGQAINPGAVTASFMLGVTTGWMGIGAAVASGSPLASLIGGGVTAAWMHSTQPLEMLPSRLRLAGRKSPVFPVRELPSTCTTVAHTLW
jgi:hypothetical protein